MFKVAARNHAFQGIAQLKNWISLERKVEGVKIWEDLVLQNVIGHPVPDNSAKERE